ncbi:MAG: UDP-N-acetylmuramoyl-L-alanine--D-glutamate ligase [Patescibacteria group bacterium]
MPVKATVFKFVSFHADLPKRRLVFNYEIKFKSGKIEKFSEEIVFPAGCDFKKMPKELLNNFLIDLHLVLGISYYKLYAPKRFEFPYHLSAGQANFFNILYRKGLGEFCYRNKIKFKDIARFKSAGGQTTRKVYDLPLKESCLVGVGGGKDSIVAIELLKKENLPINAYLLETEKDFPVARNVTLTAGIPAAPVKRKLDPKIFSSWPDSYNGHIPISAIIAFIGSLAAISSNNKYFAVANEHSSNFGNIKYDGETINHQWSKSEEFEEMFVDYLKENLTPSLKYFSLIRPYYEIRVTEMFSKMEKYFPVFTSCNRSFKVHLARSSKLWCGECPKCAFMFVMLAATLPKKKVVGIFDQNLLDDNKLLPLFEDLLGLGKMKPFDCVGTFEEMRVAFKRSSDKFADSFIVKKLSAKIKADEKKQKKVFRYNEALNLPERFKFAGVEKALIMGYAREGKVNEKFLKKYYPEIKIGIADESRDKNYLNKQKDYEIAVKTAGMPKRLVEIPYTTGTNILLSRIKNRVIGVTGSKGKSTTAALIYDILKKGGLKAKFLGNIGRPMLEYFFKKNDSEEILIVELSSYQLEDIKFSPNVAVVTNLFPEHLDYHGGLNNYYQAKKNIIIHQSKSDYFIYNKKVEELRKWAKESRGKAIPFGREAKLKIFDSPLLGKHNQENVMAAIAVAKIFKISDLRIRSAIKNFKPLPHRLEFIGEYRGIKFYDDAISTTPESTLSALSALGRVGTIFLGGTDRGYDFSRLEKEIRRLKIKNIVLFPETGKRMFKDRKGLNVLSTDKMKKAVEFAYRYTPQGYVALLSTASPSYSLWKNFEEKGDQFRKIVNKLG